MNEQNRITSFLKENQSFTTKDFIGMVKESQAAYSDRKVYRMLQDLQDDGRIMKVGRGHYSKVSVKSPYQFKASSLMDEAANIGQIPNLEKLVATIRSREISSCLVLQAQSQGMKQLMAGGGVASIVLYFLALICYY